MAGKRRGHNEGTISQRADGRWEARLSLGYEGGKAKRKCFYGKTRKEVQEALTKALRDVQQGLPVATERQTVAQFLTRWLADSVKPTVRERTHRSYADTVTLHIAPHIGRIQLDKLTGQDVQRMMGIITKETGIPTARYARTVLRIALNRAIRWGLISRNAAALVDAPKATRYEVHPMTPQQARTFLDAIRGDRLEALYTVALAMGLRQGEALGVRWQDVDLDAGTLTVRYQLQRVGGTLTLTEPKTERSRRTLSLPTVVTDALRRHRIRQLQERLWAGSKWKDTGMVFTSTIGTPLEPRNLSRRFHDALQRADLPQQRFHDLRHAAASLLLAQGASARDIMETLGHSQISTTMDLYTHIMPERKTEIAGMMDRLLAGSA